MLTTWTASSGRSLLVGIAIGFGYRRTYAQAPSIQVIIESPDTVRTRGPIALTVRVINRSDVDLNTDFVGIAGSSTAISFNVEIFDDEGRRVWQPRPSVASHTPGVVEGAFVVDRPIVIKRKRHFDLPAIWDQRTSTNSLAPSGHYTIVATVPRGAGSVSVSAPRGIMVLQIR